MSDEDLVAIVARGEERALAELYDRLGAVAFGLARRILRDPRLAEEAVQEGFLSLWRTAGRFDAERGSARAWLLTLVHRRAVDLVRSSERQRAEPLAREERAEAGADPGADELMWAQLRGERVRAVLSRLPDEQRQVIELAYFGGLTQAELAVRLGQPLGTIKSRTYAGLARLRELLAETVPEDGWSETRSTS